MSLWDIIYDTIYYTKESVFSGKVKVINKGCGRDNQPRPSKPPARQSAPGDYVPPTSIT